MTLFVGRRGNLGIGKETERGAVAAAAYTLPFNTLTFNNKTVKKDTNGAAGVIEDTDSSIVVKTYAEGNVAFDLEDKAIGLVLAALFGAAPTPSGAVNFTHTYALAESNLHQSLTLAVKDPNVATDFALAMLDTFEIKVEPEAIVAATMGVRSKPGTDGSSFTPSLTALGNIFTHAHFTFKVAANLAGLGAATAVNLTAMNLKVEKNLTDFNDMGATAVSNIVNQSLAVGGDIELGLSDQVWRDYVTNANYKAVEIAFTYGANNSLVFQMPRVSFSDWNRDQGLDSIVTQKLTFKAHRDTANNLPSIAAVLKNQVASY